MLDITNQQLYISHIGRAVESHLTQRFIPMDRAHTKDSFVYILSGTCTFTMDDNRVFYSKPGDVLYMAMGQDYSIDVTSKDYRYIVCDFAFRNKSNRKGLYFQLKNPLIAERLFRKLVTAFAIASPDRIPKCMSLLYQIYALLIQNSQTQYMPGSARRRIEESRAYIQTRITDPNLSVALLANNAQMSQVHFRKLFSELYTITPAKFITQERISYACNLMELRELELEDIALQSGFSSLPYFCKVFKATMGVTPAVYRQKYANEP